MLIPETWGCFGFFGLNNYFFNKKDVGLGYNVLACGRRHPLFFRRHVQCVMIVDKWFAADDVFFLFFSLLQKKFTYVLFSFHFEVQSLSFWLSIFVFDSFRKVDVFNLILKLQFVICYFFQFDSYLFFIFYFFSWLFC